MKIQSGFLMKTALISGLTAALLWGPPAVSGLTRPGFPFLDQELTSLLQAKNFVYEREWARAVNAFKDHLKTYPAGRYGDEAGFWLAKALDGQAGQERTIERALDRKTEAVEALNRLEKTYPKSPWLAEARPFRKELCRGIALVGGRTREAFLAGFLKEENKTLDQARLDALDALLSWDRGWAAPVIEDMLKTVADPEGRKTALRFAGRFFPDETESLLREAAGRDADAGVRSEASGALERLEMARLPVNALFFVFSARLTNAAGRAMLPENAAKVFDLAPASERNNKDAETKADALFRGKVRRLKLHGGGTIDESMANQWRALMDLLEGRLGRRQLDGDRMVAAFLPLKSPGKMDWAAMRRRLIGSDEGGAVKIRVDDVTVAFPFAACRKTPDSFSGQVVFELGEKTHPVDFSVDSRRDQLAAFRRGDDVWLAVLMFDPTALDREGFPGSRSRFPSRSPMVFQSVLGCRVESSRDSWSFEEIRSVSMIDFGRAKAEIPSPSGRWRLEGFLQADMAKKVFVGRDAELFDPSGKRVSQATEIVVPAGAADKYEIVKK